MLRIPVAQFPDIVPPRVQVTAIYPGASAAVVEAAVAQPLEAQIVGVDKMIYMKSTSGNDGSYNLTVSFAVGTNPDIATVNVNNRVQTALPQLPQAVQVQGLTVIKRSAAILQFMNLYSETGKLSPVFITSYATINVLDELSRVPGVGQALLFGKLNYSMRIWFDTQRLTSLNLAPSDVVQAIQAQNVQAPVGRIGARPVPNDQQFQLNVQTQGTLTTPEQFRKIVLRANPDGSVLRIGDVARVEMGAQNEDTETRINGQPSVGVALYLAPDANAVATAAAVARTLDAAQRPLPRGPQGARRLRFHGVRDDTISEVLWTVVEAFVLVVIVVFLFLGNLRATIIPAVAVPVSLIGTFAFLLLAGYSANTVSLLAHGAGDRHRRRRRHRRGRERRARDAGASRDGAARGDARGDAPDHRPDHRHQPGAAVGVRAGRLHPRHLGPAVPPVRGHDQRRHADLGDQRADPVAGALRHLPAPRDPDARADLPWCCAASTGCATAMPGSCSG